MTEKDYQNLVIKTASCDPSVVLLANLMAMQKEAALKDRAIQVKDTVKQIVDKIVTKGGEYAGKAKATAEDAYNKAKTKAAPYADKAKGAYEKGKEKGSEYADKAIAKGKEVAGKAKDKLDRNGDGKITFKGFNSSKA